MHLLRVLASRGVILLLFCPSASSLGIRVDSYIDALLARYASEASSSIALPSRPVIVQHSLASAQASSPAALEHSSQLQLHGTASNYPGWFWIIGIALSVLGSTLTVVGLMVQKLSHKEQSDADSSQGKMPSAFYCFDRQWLFGLMLFGLGNLLTWIALGMAPNSVLSCFMSWNIICSLVLAPRFFENDFVSMRTWKCAGLLVISCCWVAIVGPRSYRLDSIGDLGELFSYPAFHWASACLVGISLTSLLRYLHVRHDPDWHPMTVAQVVSIAAVAASYSVIFSKCTSSLTHASLASEANYFSPLFFTLVVLTVLCSFFQIHFLNEGVKHGPVSYVVPFYQSAAMGIQIVVGGILFQEYVHFTLQHHLLFWPGVTMVFVGMISLTISAGEDQAQVSAGIVVK